MKQTIRSSLRAFRDWRHQRHLLHEQHQYQQRYLQQNCIIPDDVAIRQQIAVRFPHRVPKAKGSLRILSIYHDYNWEGVCLAPALQQFGEVVHIDWKSPELAAGKLPEQPGWKVAMHHGLWQQVQQAQPFDVIFCYVSGEQFDAQLLQNFRQLGVPMVNLALNDKETFVGRVRNGYAAGARDICRYFDLCWTSTEDALQKYLVEGALPLYLPEGANPDKHKPYQEEKIYDVSFVGQCYGNRPALIAQLRLAGIDVVTFGPGWPNGPLSAEEMVRTWSRSKINLGFGSVLGHKNTFCLKGRDFEVPMSGGLYLTEHHDELLPFYEIGKELVTYHNFDDLLEKIHDLLTHPDKADAIRQAGRIRALLEHSWEMRFERVFRLLGVLN